MSGPEPDERFSRAARAALVDMIDGAAVSRTAAARRPRLALQAVVAVVVLGLVVTVSALTIGGAQGGAASSTSAGSPIPDPPLVSCGRDQGYSIAPFGCGDFVSTDATGSLAWVQSKPISLQFDAAMGGQVSIGVYCGGLGSIPLTLTTTRFRTETTHGLMTLDDFGPCQTAAYRALHQQVYDFFDGGVAYSLSGDELTVSQGDVVVHLHRTPLPSPTPVP